MAVYRIILKVVLVGALIVICIVYHSISSQKIKVPDRETDEIILEAIIQSDHGGNAENDFCYQFETKGLITHARRKSKPGLLKDLSEVDVASDSIFFLETSCSSDLKSRQSCSVESAARTNPGKQVYVLFISPVASLGPNGGQKIKKLKSIYANIHFLYIDIINFTKGTKMERWVQKQTLITSSYRVAHLSDGLRLVLLCKYGGIYFDLDVVVLHSFKNMRNFAGNESEDTINNAVISMEANGTLVNACLNEFVNDFRGDLWGYNGPNAIERALQKSCEKRTRRMWINCDGNFIIYPPRYFYPIPWTDWEMYFEEGNEKKLAQLIGNSAAVHVWNKMSMKGKVTVGSNILYGDIASKYCPLSYWNAGLFF